MAHLNSLTSIPSINPKKYDENNEYQKMDFIEHSEFGVGFVEEVMSINEIKVFFPTGTRILFQKKYLDKTINQ